MTTLLKFKQGDSGAELNLNSSSSGFRLLEDGWNPVVATPVHMGDPPPVLETLQLLLSNADHDDIATNMQSLHEMQVLAERYINDMQQETPVWLHAKMDNETGERRALVRKIEVQYKLSWPGIGATALNIPLVITFFREPYWESTTVRSLPQAIPAAAACVVYDYTAAGSAVAAHDIVGDEGARIRFFRCESSVSDYVSRLWMGIRSANKHGDLADFEEIWELEDGTNNTNESGVTDEVDATASGGDMVEVTEVDLEWDDTWQDVLVIQLEDVVAIPNNFTDNIGNFLWLLRGKVDSGTWEVKLGFSGSELSSATNRIYKDIVEFTNTSWQYKEMGIMPMPMRDYHAILSGDWSFANDGKYTITIQARRTSGSGDLNLDCLIPMPIDEGFIKWGGVDIAIVNITLLFGQSPEGKVFQMTVSGVVTYGLGDIRSIENFVLPPGDGRIYCVYERDASSDITDTILINQVDLGKYYERWLSLRGSE